MDQRYHSRLLTIEGYALWSKTLVDDGWQAFFVNFMFNHLPKGSSCFGDPMEYEACRVYRTLVTRVVREPRKEIGRLPIFWGCPDFPVWKRDKVSRRENNVNGGRHYNGLYFIPPTSRLRCGLGEHFDEKPARYVGQGRPLQRLHSTAMAYGDMTDYALKAFKNGRVAYDNVLVLPLAQSELPDTDD